VGEPAGFEKLLARQPGHGVDCWLIRLPSSRLVTAGVGRMESR
jgi:hypothetical protein